MRTADLDGFFIYLAFQIYLNILLVKSKGGATVFKSMLNPPMFFILIPLHIRITLTLLKSGTDGN